VSIIDINIVIDSIRINIIISFIVIIITVVAVVITIVFIRVMIIVVVVIMMILGLKINSSLQILSGLGKVSMPCYRLLFMLLLWYFRFFAFYQIAPRQDIALFYRTSEILLSLESHRGEFSSGWW
jgi:hypothetical protein